VVAVDAGPMQIQSWEGAAVRRVETVLQGTTHDTVCAKIGHSEKISRRPWSKELDEEVDGAARRKGAERSEGRGVLELEKVVSCRSGDHWWRAKLDFGSGEPLNDLHRSTASRATPKIGTVFFGRGVLFGLRRLLRTQQLKAKR
jgi:hypothetical protein